MDNCMSKECIKDYMDRLGGSIAEYMQMPISVRSTEAVDSMTECYAKIKGLYDMLYEKDHDDSEEHEMTEAEAMEWNRSMINADGTNGGHWTVDETTNLGKPDNITAWEWNVACNMMYSDYCEVAAKYGVGAARFFADMARAFLSDPDAVEGKLGIYCSSIMR